MTKDSVKQTQGDIRYCIGLDIGKTKLAAGIVSSDGTLVDRRQVPTNLEDGGEAILLKCEKIIQELIDSSSTSLSSIGIGSTGIIDRQRGVLVRSGAIPGWENIAVQDMFEHRFRMPVLIDNDVYAAALGEQLFGAARAAKTAIYMALSTGVGIAIMKDGKVWHGNHEIAGQIGYLPLLTFKRNVNEIVSGKGIADRATREIGTSCTSIDVFNMAREGNSIAKSIVEDAINGTALSLAWIQQIVDPDIFVLGGGIAIGLDDYIHKVEKKAHEALSHYMVRVPGGLNIVLAGLGSDSGIIGAASLMFCTN